MKVSICMITYNHEQFIEQAVTSALMQQTNFDYEIVIGEDCSTDHTREIVIELQKKYPDRIKLLLPDKNLGALENFLRAFHTCKGQYIALLEGDDYWTSPHKLQKQVEFLDQHPDFAMCFHDATVIYEDGSQEPHKHRPHVETETITLQDLLIQNYMATASVLFRRGLFGAFPAWYYKVSTGDWALHIMNAQCGKIKYINENMSVYRVHATGTWSTRDSTERNLSRKQMYQYLSTYLEPQNRPLLEIPMRRCDWVLTYQYQVSGNRSKVRAYLRKCLTQYGFSKDIPFKEYCSLFLWLNVPPLYNLLRSLKHLCK